MRKSFFLLFFFCVLQLTSYGQDRYVTVTSLKANLRGTPSTSGVILTEVKKDEAFKLIEERGSWYLVQTPNYVGWLNGSTIRFTSPETDIIKNLKKKYRITESSESKPPSEIYLPPNTPFNTPSKLATSALGQRGTGSGSGCVAIMSPI